MDWRHLKLLPLLALTALALAAPPSARAESLEARLHTLLASDQLKNAAVGIDIVEVTPQGPLSIYAHNATTPLVPASNMKILTTAAAFEKYGPKATFKTQLFKSGDDLLLIGGGDPALGDAKLLAEAGQSPTAPFEEFAAALKKTGLTTYRDLIVDDRVFDQTFIHPNWPADQALSWYSAPVGGLNFNANCLDWLPKLTNKGVGIELIPRTSYVSVTVKATRGPSTKVWLWRPVDSNHFEMRGTVAASASSQSEPESVTIVDPGLWTGTILRDILAANGLTPTGTVRRAAAADRFTGQLLATHETPLLSVLKRANKNSLNMMAEALCKRLGHDATREPGDWTNGPAAVAAHAVAAGADKDWLTLDDGSGLSSKNRVAAKAFTAVLAHVAARPDADLYIDTLAIPGEDGTLKKRFARLSVAPGIHAKTGHIDRVSTLSGFVDIPAPSKDAPPRRFAFSILCNKYIGNVNPWQDQVCQALHDWVLGK